MEVGEAILAVGAGARPASFEQFSAALDPQWIAAALAATGTASVRRRKLPAEHVLWLVIGMGLFRDRSIAQVVHHLDLVLPTPRGDRRRITNAAIVQARDQLGAAPLAALFTQTATAWAPAAAAADRWRGLAVYGLDGTTLRVADTPENVAHFGRPPSRDGEGAGYPQLRLVALLALRAHLLAAAAFGPYRTSELALATQVWDAVPEHAVVILDRGFCSYALFHALGAPDRDRHWLVRARSGPTALTRAIVQRFGPGDVLVELRPSRATCAKHPDLPATLRVRAVRVPARLVGAMRAHTDYLWFNTAKRHELVNITDRVAEIVAASKVQDGLCLVSAMHITAGIWVNDEESGLKHDVMEWLEQLAPAGDYRHHQTGEDNADAHLKRTLVHHQVILPITRGALDLGPWEQVFYAEFDGRPEEAGGGEDSRRVSRAPGGP